MDDDVPPRRRVEASVLIRIALSREAAQQWCAHALECDIVVAAATADAALDVLIKLVEAQTSHDQRQQRALLGRFAAAPKTVWKTFASAAAAKAPITVKGGQPGGSFQFIVATAAPTD